MPGPPSRLNDKVHKAILQVIEDSSIDNSDSLEDICLSRPKFFQIFGLRGEEHRRLVKFQLQNYKRRKAKNPKNYARACIKFGVEVDQATNPIVFEWIGTFTADQDEVTEAAATMTSSAKKAKRPMKRDYDDCEDEDAATIGFTDEFFDGNNNYITPTKSKTKKGVPRSSYVGGDNGNALGEKVVVYLPDGFIFCILWVDARLNHEVLQFLVSEDGMKIIQRKKKPRPPSASTMLSQVYRFAQDPKHMVVAQVEAELSRLKIGVQPNKEWDEETIVDLKEEVLKMFYDVHGTATNQIQYHRDQSDGRQWISFFMKTVRAQEAPQVGNYCNDDRGMPDVEDDETVTTAEMRAEMDERINRMGEEMARRQEEMMRQGVENTRQMMEQFMQMNMANNNNQQHPQQPHNQQEEYVRQQQAALAYQQQAAAAAAVHPDNATS